MSDAVLIAIVTGIFGIVGKVVDMLLTRARAADAAPPKRRRRSDPWNPFKSGGVLNPATIGFLVLGVVVAVIIANSTGGGLFNPPGTVTPTPPDIDQTAVPTQQVTDAPTGDPSGLVIGGHGVVHTTGGDRLRVREQPDFSSKVSFQLDNGILVTLMDGPRVVGADRWWLIQTTDGRNGWAVESVGGVQTILPVSP